ncbi:DUF1801 domain-containing protein [Shewanella corallii]|uniref:DUF1801 domain-containing protein n=1 Tax=Shewanella corallii TaxID=560080 RepID=A0ABT0N3K6_9GAMM|nr:DUF1801 domain-containing protein [Shewanella corallii]MCL2912685.1 DUF1801 domain-containing protein [Shewanella corallii]
MSEFEINAWLHKVPAPQLTTVNSLRHRILGLGDDIKEEFKWGRPCYSNSRGPFCYLASAKDHATLGFEQGAGLSDPEGLLEGEGKLMRHIKFSGSLSHDSPSVVALLEQAYKLTI